MPRILFLHLGEPGKEEIACVHDDLDLPSRATDDAPKGPGVTLGRRCGRMAVHLATAMGDSTQQGLFEPAALGPWEESGFAAVYAEHARAIYYLALRLLGDPTQAEDATHDVFLKAYRKFAGFRGDSAVRTWLYRIAINHCRNLQQSWSARHLLSNADEAVWERAASAADSPLRVLETKELGQRIQKTLDALPPEYRELLLLVADERLSYQEVADLTSQSADAVRGKLHRARRAFAAAFATTA